MNAYVRIQEAKREREKYLLGAIRRANRAGALWNFWYGGVVGSGHGANLNALERLIDAGEVVCTSDSVGTVREATGSSQRVLRRLAGRSAIARGRVSGDCYRG